MKGNSILTETTSATHTLSLVESSEAVKSGSALCTLSGPFADATVPTRNNRLYTVDLWRKVLSSSHVKEMLDTKTFFGEADHPSRKEERLEVSLPKVSHVITDLWLDEKDHIVYGKLDILDTPSGRILKTMVDYGSVLGISSRGAGQVITQGKQAIVDPDTYNFVTLDIVPLPANVSARLNPAVETNPVSMVDAIGEQVSSLLSKNDKSELVAVQSVLESLDLPDLQPLCEQVSNALNHSDTITTSVESDLEEAYKTISSLREQVSQLESQVRRYESDSSTKESNTSALPNEAIVEALDISFTTVLSELSSIKGQLESTHSKEYNTLQVEYTKLSKEAEGLKSDLTEYKQLLAENKRNSSQLSESNLELSKEIDSLKSGHSKLEETLSTITSERDSILSENKQLKLRITQLDKDLKDNKSEYSTIKESLDSTLSTINKEKSDLEKEVEVLNQQVAISERESLKLKGYKEFASAYIKLRASQLGVNPQVALNALPESITPDLVENTLRELAQSQVNHKKVAYTNRTPSPGTTSKVLSESTHFSSHGSDNSSSLISIVRGASSK